MNRSTAIVRTWFDAQGVEQEVTFPTIFVVCHGCHGRGSHVNRAVDGNGLTQADFDDDPDFREDYFSGVYDVTCDTCGGQRVLPEVDEEKCTPRQLEIIAELEADDAQERADWESERYLRAAECGEWA